MPQIEIDFYASTGDWPSYVSAPVPVDDNIRHLRWWTSEGDEVQKEPMTWDKYGEVEVYEAIFPSGGIDATTQIATIHAYNPNLPEPSFSTTSEADYFKSRLRTVIRSDGVTFNADYTNALNPAEEVLKSGEWLIQYKKWAPFRKAADDTTLMGGMGVHYYVTQLKDQNMLQVDYLISNAALTDDEIAADPVVESTQCVKQYYDTLYLDTGDGETVSEDWDVFTPMPRASQKGESPGQGYYENVKASDNVIVSYSGSHLFPTEAGSFRRRYYYVGEAMSGEATKRGEWKYVGHAVNDYSYNRIPCWGGRGLLQPKLPRPTYFDIREGKYSNSISQMRSQYANGEGGAGYTLHHDALGFFQPMLQQNDGPGLGGGRWICPCIGWHPTPLELFASDLWTAGRIERHRQFQFSMTDGRILTPEDWQDGDGKVKFPLTAVGGATAVDHPAYDRTQDESSSCPYETSLYAYTYTHSSHLSRQAMHSEIVAFNANDSLAKDIVRVIASRMRHVSTHHEVDPFGWGTNESVNHKLKVADSGNNGFIKRGLTLYRTDAWMINQMADEYILTNPELDPSGRASIHDTLASMADVMAYAGDNPGGVLLREIGNSETQTSTVAVAGNANAWQYDLCKQFEHALVMQGLHTIRKRCKLPTHIDNILRGIAYRNSYWMYKQTPYVGDPESYPNIGHFCGVAYWTADGEAISGILTPHHYAAGGGDWWHLHRTLTQNMEHYGNDDMLQVIYDYTNTSSNSGEYVDYILDPNGDIEDLDGSEPLIQYAAHLVAHLQNGMEIFPYRKYG